MPCAFGKHEDGGGIGYSRCALTVCIVTLLSLVGRGRPLISENLIMAPEYYLVSILELVSKAESLFQRSLQRRQLGREAGLQAPLRFALCWW